MPDLLLAAAVYGAFPATYALSLAWHAFRRQPSIYAAADTINYGSLAFAAACGLALWLG